MQSLIAPSLPWMLMGVNSSSHNNMRGFHWGESSAREGAATQKHLHADEEVKEGETCAANGSENKIIYEEFCTFYASYLPHS